MKNNNKDRKLTDKYVFRIDRIAVRPPTWEENHGMQYQARGHSIEEVEEPMFVAEYEIKEKKVVDILVALLKSKDS